MAATDLAAKGVTNLAAAAVGQVAKHPAVEPVVAAASRLANRGADLVKSPFAEKGDRGIAGAARSDIALTEDELKAVLDARKNPKPIAAEVQAEAAVSSDQLKTMLATVAKPLPIPSVPRLSADQVKTILANLKLDPAVFAKAAKAMQGVEPTEMNRQINQTTSRLIPSLFLPLGIFWAIRDVFEAPAKQLTLREVLTTNLKAFSSTAKLVTKETGPAILAVELKAIQAKFATALEKQKRETDNIVAGISYHYKTSPDLLFTKVFDKHVENLEAQAIDDASALVKASLLRAYKPGRSHHGFISRGLSLERFEADLKALDTKEAKSRFDDAYWARANKRAALNLFASLYSRSEVKVEPISRGLKVLSATNNVENLAHQLRQVTKSRGSITELAIKARLWLTNLGQRKEIQDVSNTLKKTVRDTGDQLLGEFKNLRAQSQSIENQMRGKVVDAVVHNSRGVVDALAKAAGSLGLEKQASEGLNRIVSTGAKAVQDLLGNVGSVLGNKETVAKIVNKVPVREAFAA